VAPSFLFLACEDSSYMTAQVLHPDGGDTTSSWPPLPDCSFPNTGLHWMRTRCGTFHQHPA